MKRSYPHMCRHCRCTEDRSCRIVTQRGTRDCQWQEPGLCDNPQCLVTEAQRVEKPVPDLAKASRLRERAEQIRRNGA
jgi:hypothetical protein